MRFASTWVVLPNLIVWRVQFPLQDLAARIGPMIASNLRDVCQACRGAVKRMGGKGTPAEMSGLAGESQQPSPCLNQAAQTYEPKFPRNMASHLRTMRFGRTTKGLAKRILKYFRIL